MKALKTLLLAFWEEFFHLCHSPAACMVMIGGVLFYSLLYPVPYYDEVPQKLPIALVDHDHSGTSRTLLRMIQASEGASVAEQHNELSAALENMISGKVNAVLYIPFDFERDLLRGTPSVLPLYASAGYLLPYRMIYRAVRIPVEQLGAGVRVQRLTKLGMPERAALSMQVRGQVSVRTLYNPAGSYALNTIPAAFVLILQQTLLIGSALLYGKRYAHFFSQRLPLAPLTAAQPTALLTSQPTALLTAQPAAPALASALAAPLATILGRSLCHTALYSVHMLYFFWVLPLFFGFPRLASPSAMAFFFLPFFLAVSWLGAALGPLARKPERVFILLLPCSLPILFLSGFAWPLEAMPRALSALAQILPTTPAISGYLLMSERGASLSEVLPHLVHLWGLAFLFLSLALAMSNYRPKPDKNELAIE